MKKVILLFILFLSLFSCNRDNNIVNPSNNSQTYTNVFAGGWIGEEFQPLSNGDTTYITHVAGNTYTITDFDYIVRHTINCTCDTVNYTININSWDDQNHHVIGSGYINSDTLYITYSIENTSWQNYSSKWYREH